MVCVYCEEERDDVLPMAVIQAGSGLSQAPVCRHCGQENGLWCKSCGWPKTSVFGEDNPVCLFCIEAEIKERRHDATAVREHLFPPQLTFQGWMDLAEKATHQPLFVKEELDLSILRLLVVRAHVERTTVEEIITHLRQQHAPAQVQV